MSGTNTTPEDISIGVAKDVLSQSTKYIAKRMWHKIIGPQTNKMIQVTITDLVQNDSKLKSFYEDSARVLSGENSGVLLEALRTVVESVLLSITEDTSRGNINAFIIANESGIPFRTIEKAQIQESGMSTVYQTNTLVKRKVGDKFFDAKTQSPHVFFRDEVISNLVALRITYKLRASRDCARAFQLILLKVARNTVLYLQYTGKVRGHKECGFVNELNRIKSWEEESTSTIDQVYGRNVGECIMYATALLWQQKYEILADQMVKIGTMCARRGRSKKYVIKGRVVKKFVETVSDMVGADGADGNNVWKWHRTKVALNYVQQRLQRN